MIAFSLRDCGAWSLATACLLFIYRIVLVFLQAEAAGFTQMVVETV